MGNKEEKNNTVPNGSMEITGRRHKSARPGRISYVPISDEDLAPYEPPIRINSLKEHQSMALTVQVKLLMRQNRSLRRL